ncbi:S46 family peptidase [Crocinitomix algicola]|uniref:S46 family peptidase n=1 Tax=Crocinitomix algicola TaxID=1740263 RepID=UPI00087336F1|nr:S46 family peptidase [Crocinitomix algicola]
MKKILFLSLMIAAGSSYADEGMLLPFQLKKYKKEMRAKGLELKAKEIYNPKKPSVKDAIVSLGGFCTGELISDKGLMLTNHHCGYDAIRENSTPENDYLTDGFWASNYSEEKPIPGLTATIVVRIDDVTKDIYKFLNDGMSESEREEKIQEVSARLIEEATAGTNYNAEIKPFYEGNEFYLFVNETFKDVRLVGAPPSAIGKYGGDTDNWMWERHTGDFTMFRVYANNQNEPAEFAMDNQPYQPKHHLPISLKGVEENDFAMVMGFPGSTDRYLTSYGVKMAIEKDQPSRVKVRGKKLELMKEDMNASDAVRIQYASTYAQVSNYWKYFIGQTEQLERNKVTEKKVAIEQAFTQWINEKDKRKQRYGNVLTDIEEAYKTLTEINPTKVYFFEAIYSVALNKFMISHVRFFKKLKSEASEEEIKKAAEPYLKAADEFFSSINIPTEIKLIEAMLKMYYEDVPSSQQPEEFKKLAEEYKSNWEELTRWTTKSSVFTSIERYKEFLENPTATTLEAEPLFLLNEALLMNYLSVVNGEASAIAQAKLDKANRLFIEGLRIMNKEKKYYPNANFSLRLTYGNVLPYTSNEGKKYPFYTTMKGLMAKEDPNNPEFIVPSKLKELYETRDYGRYGKDGELWVNFITNNDITGGNSGSPVMNSKGELIGCAFDGNWEAMSGDIAFEDDFQRTICVDIRYVLFVVDKYAGASHLIDEMTIVE